MTASHIFKRNTLIIKHICESLSYQRIDRYIRLLLSNKNDQLPFLVETYNIY